MRADWQRAQLLRFSLSDLSHNETNVADACNCKQTIFPEGHLRDRLGAGQTVVAARSVRVVPFFQMVKVASGDSTEFAYFEISPY